MTINIASLQGADLQTYLTQPALIQERIAFLTKQVGEHTATVERNAQGAKDNAEAAAQDTLNAAKQQAESTKLRAETMMKAVLGASTADAAASAEG